MRILVGLIEHLGDIIACEPVCRYLKINHPGAHLTWAVSSAYRELIDTNPHIDETLVLECLTDWIKLSKHGAYDKIVDLHVNYRICQHCGIPLVKEIGNPFVNVYEWFDYGTLLEAFAIGAGLPGLCAQPNLYLKPEHVKAVDALALPNDFCVLHRESNESTKDWTDTGWRELSEWIRDELGLKIVEVGAGNLRMPSPFTTGYISLVNRLPILQTGEVIRRARFFVGVDSGPAHLANALQVPGVVLLGRLGLFRQYMPFSGFFGSPSPQVKIVRNLAGPVSALTASQVIEAVSYVSAASVNRRDTPVRLPQISAPIPKPPYSLHHEEHRRLVLESGLFDAGWYKIHNSDVSDIEVDPLDHFLTIGKGEGRSTGPAFDDVRYLQAYEDVTRSGVNPLLHYILQGRKEGRQHFKKVAGPECWPDQTPPESRGREMSGISVLEQTIAASAIVRPKKNQSDSKYPRTFAFYLPQFHPIAENSWAHGPGFTEWHSVIKAKPLFRNHYQPRVPGELGFYDLRSLDVLREQLDLARRYGISGFCFYYYYFQGRKVLYQPIKNYVESDMDAPFLLLWANENWSKRWDGGDKEVIIEQKHSNEDDLAFIRGLLPMFEDSRYVNIHGKPVLLIYKPHLFPDILNSTERWREEVERQGFPGLYLVMVDDWFPDQFHPRQYGFDATYEIPSNCIPQEVLSNDLDPLELKEGFEGRIVDYPKFASFHLGRPFPEYKRFRTVMLPWDNTARYGSRAIVHINGQGDSYKCWLTQALLDTYRRYPNEERIVFLHSWNEWCEGTYLEPDGKFGRMYLEQTREAIAIVRSAIDLMEESPESVHAIAELIKVMKSKDEGAFRVMRATRMQTTYIWRELQRAQNEMANLRDSVIQLREALSRCENQERLMRASRSWRMTSAFRAIAAGMRRNR